jgi:hypothetical protein
MVGGSGRREHPDQSLASLKSRNHPGHFLSLLRQGPGWHTRGPAWVPGTHLTRSFPGCVEFHDVMEDSSDAWTACPAAARPTACGEHGEHIICSAASRTSVMASTSSSIRRRASRAWADGGTSLRALTVPGREPADAITRIRVAALFCSSCATSRRRRSPASARLSFSKDPNWPLRASHKFSTGSHVRCYRVTSPGVGCALLAQRLLLDLRP